ncbi:hypothetical protein BVRB_1g019260 [Beta vulgaris subsp. vulgaris]|uniref:probable xyloglucan galactosyltransferase GT11 n=1 Tax=Beta vulgaris subsp. vulgaris TaxID=3555 RepID=UPI000540132A|nr:probable xyloglucan galactosyltransferase GT11 [Beta vulgaris subsp. vulgaris]KMT00102.1 hypothetical protein BVRB_1g019260 [Beta vulgaris subsp. vulgaris]
MKVLTAFKGFKKKSWLIVLATICFLWLCYWMPNLNHTLSYSYTIRQMSKDIELSIMGRVPAAEGNQSYNQKSQQQDLCLGRYIYMHDLPPRFNRDLVTKCETLRKEFNFCRYVENDGFGSQLTINDSAENMMSRESWYATHQFILEMIFHRRMKQYECLTPNSSLASAIYAPFYPGLEVSRYLWGGFSSSVKDAGALDFTTWLKGRPEWEHMSGWDHFFVTGRLTWDFRRPTYMGPDWGSKLMKLPETRNMTLLTVDSSPYAYNDFAVPYPSYFHPSHDNEVLQWQEWVRKAKRSYLSAFAGAPRPNITTSIRGELISQCKNASTNHCKLVSCAPNDKVNCNSPDYIIKAFMMSDFCLQPPGDSGTRRSTFDAILAGCIPVFFHPGSAYTQYFWHLPKNYTSYSVFIPQEGIKNGTVSVVEILLQIPQNVVTAMREMVIGLIPNIIYARNKLTTTEDAFDITINGILQRIEDFRGDIQEGKDPRSKFPENSFWKYYLTGKLEKHEWDSYFRRKQ